MRKVPYGVRVLRALHGRVPVIFAYGDAGSSGRGVTELSAPQTHSTSEWTVEEPPGYGRGIRSVCRTIPCRLLRAPSTRRTAAASSSPPSLKTFTIRRNASLTSVRVTAGRSVLLDRQREQLLPGRADLDVGVHLRRSHRPAAAPLISTSWTGHLAAWRPRGRDIKQRARGAYAQWEAPLAVTVPDRGIRIHERAVPWARARPTGAYR